MGALECTCSRERYEDAKKQAHEKYDVYSVKAIENYIVMKEKAKGKIEEAKVKYAP